MCSPARLIVCRLRESESGCQPLSTLTKMTAVNPVAAEGTGNCERALHVSGGDREGQCGANVCVLRGKPIEDLHLPIPRSSSGITDHVRPFHDLRHTAITLDAASGASGPAIMTKAGHSSFATTQTYLHLAGTVLRDEAERMERTALGGSSTELSTDLSEPQGTEQDPVGLTTRD